jgi:deoxyribodipyrimidine photo-lyase
MSTTLREQSLNKLENFISKGLPYYSFKRNYDLGPSNRTNISLLSPYIRKRILHEKERLDGR